MRNAIIAALAAIAMGSAVAPAFAADNVANCNNLPRSQWAQCVVDQAAARSSQ